MRLPDELGGAWVVIIESHLRTLPDGRIGRHHILAHPEVDAIALLNGDGILWVRKQIQEKTHTCMDNLILECEACAETGGEEE